MEPLRATCTTKVKANSVKQEFEKQEELKRSAMRAVAALLNVPDAGELYLYFAFDIFHKVIFIPRHTIVAGYYGFTLDIRVSVRPSVFHFWMIT